MGLEYHYVVVDMRVSRIPTAEESTEWLKRTCEYFDFGLDGVSRKDFVAPVPGPAYTLVGILSESHAVIHTAPEESWVEVVFASCRAVGIENLLKKVKEFYKPEAVRVTSFVGSVPRGSG